MVPDGDLPSMSEKSSRDPTYRWASVIAVAAVIAAAAVAAVVTLWVLDGSVTLIPRPQRPLTSSFAGLFAIFVFVGALVLAPLWGLREKLLLRHLLRKYGSEQAKLPADVGSGTSDDKPN